MPEVHPDAFGDPFDSERMEVAALIPLRASEDSIDFSETLVRRTIEAAQASRYINRILVTTECEDLAAMARACGAEVPFLRPVALSTQGVRVDEVLKFFLYCLERDGYLSDIVVPLEINYPFRPEGLLDGVIDLLVREGADTVIAGVSEYRPCWKKNGEHYEALTKMEQSRMTREPIHVGLPSLACASYPSTLRQGSRMAGQVGIYEIVDPLAAIEIRNHEDYLLLTERMKIK